MSMLSAQIDELREAANLYEQSGIARNTVTMLREAADTIWQLRDDLQRANAENAVLRTQLADVTESMGRVEERCAKLRELCADLYAEMITYSSAPHYNASVWTQKLSELGVEVDDA